MLRGDYSEITFYRDYMSWMLYIVPLILLMIKIIFKFGSYSTEILTWTLIATYLVALVGYVIKPVGLRYAYTALQPTIDVAEMQIEIRPMEGIFIDMGNIREQAVDGVREANTGPIDVHDTQVQQSIVLACKRLADWQQKADVSKADILSDIRKYIFNEYDGTYTEKERAYITLRTIESVNGYVVNINMHELDVLKMVWSRICAPINKDKATELKSVLLESLADSTISVNNTRCLTGRVTRIVQSLESLDAEEIVNIRSVNTLRQEIMNKFPVLLNEYLSAHPKEKTIYETSDDPSVRESIRAYIDASLRKEYLPIANERTYRAVSQDYFDHL